MKVTKKQLVDFIHNNFKGKDGKKIPKKSLNEHSKLALEGLISSYKCQDRLEAWVNKPKMIKFMVNGIEDGKEYSWDCEYPNEEECKKSFEDNGVEVIKIVTASNHHRCLYCGEFVEGKMRDLLCDECQEVFGHTYYSEL